MLKIKLTKDEEIELLCIINSLLLTNFLTDRQRNVFNLIRLNLEKGV